MPVTTISSTASWAIVDSAEPISSAALTAAVTGLSLNLGFRAMDVPPSIFLDFVERIAKAARSACRESGAQRSYWNDRQRL
jgi:hypothetical protein